MSTVMIARQLVLAATAVVAFGFAPAPAHKICPLKQRIVGARHTDANVMEVSASLSRRGLRAKVTVNW